MSRQHTLTVLMCLAVSGCSIPGVETSSIVSQGIVDVAGRDCDYVMREYATPTVNGMSRYYSSSISCDGQTFDCGDADGEVCISQVATALAT